MSSEYRLERLKPNNHRPTFDCGDSDLNEYYLEDSKIACVEFMAVSYVLYYNDCVVAYYCVSNDAIHKDMMASNRKFKRFQERIKTEEKRYKTIPAVKIGRFAVASNQQGVNIGTMLMDAIKHDFITNNKTGCRFITVDAYNKPKVIRFYKNNGFEFLLDKDDKDDTRIMVFDLMVFSDARNDT